MRTWWRTASQAFRRVSIDSGRLEPQVLCRLDGLMNLDWIGGRGKRGSFACLGRFRRLSKDYEFLPAASEAVIHLAMVQLLVRRLARGN